jgi:hypothetical protein
MDRGGFLQRLRAAGLVLALCALTFKAMLPPGFMLDVGAARIAITLCGDGAGGEVYFDPTTGKISHDDGSAPSGDGASEHCPFAFASSAALIAPVSESAPPRPALRVDAAPAREAAGEHDATGPPLPPRGPPLIA